MSYVEMEIDSLRHAMYKDEWVILLKDKAGDRYLPVYVDRDCADMVGKVLMGEERDEILDDKVLKKIQEMMAMADEVSLMIDDVGDGGFKARFVVGRGDSSFDVECPVGKGLTMAMKADMGVLVKKMPG